MPINVSKKSSKKDVKLIEELFRRKYLLSCSILIIILLSIALFTPAGNKITGYFGLQINESENDMQNSSGTNGSFPLDANISLDNTTGIRQDEISDIRNMTDDILDNISKNREVPAETNLTNRTKEDDVEFSVKLRNRFGYSTGHTEYIIKGDKYDAILSSSPGIVALVHTDEYAESIVKIKDIPSL